MTTPIIITKVQTFDIRFPTSLNLDGSDAMNRDPDYSATYVMLHTNHPEFAGYGLTFTIGRGNEWCVAAAQTLAERLVGRDLATITADLGAFWYEMVGDSQLRWVGPEKGVVHLAVAAVVNAVWDLYARVEGKPLWRLLVDMSPAELVRCIPFRYISDALTPAEALGILTKSVPQKAARIAAMQANGYPAYTTSAGWIGYSDEKVRQLCHEAIAAGFTHIKMKVGIDIASDVRRAGVIRDVIGPDRFLMVDANQVWDVPQAIEWMQHLQPFHPLWIEEPTSPDDVLGHAAIARGVAPIGVATGEHVQNRIMFKQLLQANAISFCQIDACRVGGVNEVLAIILMAAKFDVPVCPHAGGVGLCEYVQHLSLFDFVAVTGSTAGRVIEYVDHLHEHFVDPCVIRNAHYMPPQLPGYSIEMKAATIEAYKYPDGPVWQALGRGK
ncbi:MAG: L-fuconate dehydratase [Chloroflexales bacterium]|nr:L-fuconate dehydratase [Chloroflexales bacterium]